MSKGIVTVWHDDTSADVGWVVEKFEKIGGGCTLTVEVCDTRAEAIAYAETYAKKSSLQLEIIDE